MTYSIGFRAPARADLIAGWAEHVAGLADEGDRYGDPDLRRQANPGEIDAGAIDRLHAMIAGALGDRDGFARWFGRHGSLPKYPEVDWRPEDSMDHDTLRAHIAAGGDLIRNPASRFAFYRGDSGGSGTGMTLFVDGHDFDCTDAATTAFAERLCAGIAPIAAPGMAGDAAVMALIARLVDQGSVAIDGQD
jgi:50S ribosomal protein L16 3-hydroxylase